MYVVMEENINTPVHSVEGINYYSGLIKPAPGVVFVFGSNPEGRHGAGAAKIARESFGAVYGQGEGLQGNAYAIPTKDIRVRENNALRSISPESIVSSIRKMYETAARYPERKFMIAYTNTDKASLNGYTGFEMIRMFIDAGTLPSNVYISEQWFNTGLFQEALASSQAQKADINTKQTENNHDMATYRELTLAPGQRIDLTGKNITAIMQDPTGFNLYRLTEIVGNEAGETLVKGKKNGTGTEYRTALSDPELSINEEGLLNEVISEHLNEGIKEENQDRGQAEAPGMSTEGEKMQAETRPDVHHGTDAGNAQEQFSTLAASVMESVLNQEQNSVAKEIISNRMQDSILPLLDEAGKVKYHAETFGMLSPEVQAAVLNRAMEQGATLREDLMRGAQKVGDLRVQQEATLSLPGQTTAADGTAEKKEIAKVSFRSIPMMDERSYAKFTAKKASGVQPVSELTIVPAAEVKTYVAQHGAVDSLRHPGAFAPYVVKAGEKSVSIDTHLGNPFSHEAERMQGASVKTESVEDAVKEFEAWLVGAKSLNVEPERKAWIIKNILDGTFYGKPLVYYTSAIPTPKEGADWQKGYGAETQYSMDKAPCHAHIELKYINDPALLVKNINEVNALRNRPVSIDEAKAWFRALPSGRMLHFLNMDNLRQDKPGRAEQHNTEARGIIAGRMQDSMTQLMDEPGKAKYFAETFDMLPSAIQAEIFNQAAVEEALTTMHHWIAPAANLQQETSASQGLDTPGKAAVAVDAGIPDYRRVHAEETKAKEEEIKASVEAARSLDVSRSEERMSPEEWKAYKKEAWRSAAPRVASIWFASLPYEAKQKALNGTNWDAKARNPKYISAPYVEEANKFIAGAVLPQSDAASRNQILNASFDKLSDDAKLYIFYGTRPELNMMREWMSAYLDELDKKIATAKDKTVIVTETKVSSPERLSDFVRAGYLTTELVRSTLVFDGFESVGEGLERGRTQEQARQLDAWLHGDLSAVQKDKEAAKARLRRLHDDILDGKLIGRPVLVDNILNRDGSYGGATYYSYPNTPMPEQVLKHMIDNPEELADLINTTESLWLQRVDNLSFRVAQAYKSKESPLSEEGMELYRKLDKPGDVDQALDNISSMQPLYAPFDAFAALSEADRAVIIKEAPYLGEQVVEAIDYVRKSLSDKGNSFKLEIHDSDDSRVILDYFFSMPAEDRSLVIKETPGLAEDFTVAFSESKKSFSEHGRKVCTALTSAPKRIVTEEDFMRFAEADRKTIMRLNPVVNKDIVYSATVEKLKHIDKEVKIANGDYRSNLISNGALSLDDYHPLFESPFRKEIANGWTMEEVIDATEKWLTREDYKDLEPKARDTFYRAVTSGALIGRGIVSSERMRPYAEWLLQTINNPRTLAMRFVVTTMLDSENRSRIMKENDPVKIIKSSDINPYSDALSWFSSLNEKQMSTVLCHAAFDIKDEKQKRELEMLSTVLSKWTDRPAAVKVSDFRLFLKGKPEYMNDFENIKNDTLLQILNKLPVQNESELNGMKLSANQNKAILSFSDTLPKHWDQLNARERLNALGTLIPDELKTTNYISQLVGVALKPADSSLLTLVKPTGENEKPSYVLSPSEYAAWLIGKNPQLMPEELKDIHRNILSGKIYPWDLAEGEKAWVPGEGEPQSQEAVLRYYVENPSAILNLINETPAFWTSYKRDAYDVISKLALSASSVLSDTDKKSVTGWVNATTSEERFAALPMERMNVIIGTVSLSDADKQAVGKVMVSDAPTAEKILAVLSAEGKKALLNAPAMANTTENLFAVLSEDGKKAVMASNPVMTKKQLEVGPTVHRIQTTSVYAALFSSLSEDTILRLRDEFDNKMAPERSIKNGKLYRNEEAAMEVFSKETSYKGLQEAIMALSEMTGTTRSVSTSYLGETHLSNYIANIIGPEPQNIDPTLTEDAVLDFVRASFGGTKTVEVEDGVVRITGQDGASVTYSSVDDLLKDATASPFAAEPVSEHASSNDSELNTDEDNEEQLLAEDRIDYSSETEHSEDVNEGQEEETGKQASVRQVLKEANVNINWEDLERRKAEAKKTYASERRSYMAAYGELAAEVIATHGPINVTALRKKMQNWDGIWQNMSLAEKAGAVEMFVSDTDIHNLSGDTQSDAVGLKNLLGTDEFQKGTPEQVRQALDGAYKTLCPDSKSLITGKVRVIEEIGRRFDALSPEQQFVLFDLAKEEVRKSDRELIAAKLYPGWDDALTRGEAAKALSSLFRSLATTSMKKIVAHIDEISRLASKNVPYNVVTLAAGLERAGAMPKSRAEFFASMPSAPTDMRGRRTMLIYDTRTKKAAGKSNVSKDQLKSYCDKNGLVYFDASGELFEHGSDKYNAISTNIREWASAGARVVLVTSNDNPLQCDLSLTLCQELYRSGVSVGHIFKGSSGTEVYEHRTLMFDFLRKHAESRLVSGSYADIDVSVTYDENKHRKVEFGLLNGAKIEKNASAASRRLFSEKQANYTTGSFQTKVVLKDHGFISHEELIRETAESCGYGIFFVRQNEDASTIIPHADTKLAENAINGHKRIVLPSTKEELQDRKRLHDRVARLLKDDVLVSRITALGPGDELRLFVGGDNIAELTTGISTAGARRASADNLSQEQNGTAHQEDSLTVVDTNEQVGVDDLTRYVRDFMEELSAQLRDYEYIKKTEFSEATKTSIPFRVVNVGESGVQQEVNDKMMEIAARYKTESYFAEINHTPKFTTTQVNPQFYKDHNLGKRYSDKALFLNYYNRSLPLKYTLEEINRETVTRELDRSAAITVRGGRNDTVNRQTALDVFYKMGFSAEDSFALSCMLPADLDEVTPAALIPIIRNANRANEVVMPMDWSAETVQKAFSNFIGTEGGTVENRALRVVASIAERRSANGDTAPVTAKDIASLRLEIASELYAQSLFVTYDREFGKMEDDIQHVDPLLRAQGFSDELLNQYRQRSGLSVQNAAEHVGIIDKKALVKAMSDIEAAMSDPTAGTRYILAGQGVTSSKALEFLGAITIKDDSKYATEKSVAEVQPRKLQKALSRADIAIGALSEIYAGLDIESFRKVLESFRSYVSKGYTVDSAGDLRAFLYDLSKQNAVTFPEDLTRKNIEESINYVKEYHTRAFDIPEGTTTPEVATLLCNWFGNTMAVQLISLVPEFYKESGRDVCDAESLAEFLQSNTVQEHFHNIPLMEGLVFNPENINHDLQMEAERRYRMLDTKVIGTLTFTDSCYPDSLRKTRPYVIDATEARVRPKRNRITRKVTGDPAAGAEMVQLPKSETPEERLKAFAKSHPILVDLDTVEGRQAVMTAEQGTPILAWTSNLSNPVFDDNGYREKIESDGGMLISRELFDSGMLDEGVRSMFSFLQPGSPAVYQKELKELREREERARKAAHPQVTHVKREQRAPAAITYRGNAELLNDPNSLGIISFIGETRISQNENNNRPIKNAVNNIISELSASQEKLTIAASLNCASGRAVIEAALNNGLPVVAVTADKLSGSANSTLIQRIVAAGGVVVSEADTVQLNDRDIVYDKEILVARSSRLLAELGTMAVAMECLHDSDVRMKADRRESQDVRRILADREEGVCVLSYGTTRTLDIINSYLDVKDGETINYDNLYHTLSINGLVTEGEQEHPDYSATVDSKGMKQYWEQGTDTFKQYIRHLHSQMKREPHEYDAAMSLVKKDNVLTLSPSGEGVRNMLNTMRSITANQEYVTNRYSNERLVAERNGYGILDQPTKLVPVYRYADKQVFVVEESLSAVRDCIRRTYGDDVLFADTERGAQRLMNTFFDTPKPSTEGGAVVVNEKDMSKTVVIYTSVADDAGQIFSLQNCPAGLLHQDVNDDAVASESRDAFLAYVDATRKTMSVAYELAGYEGQHQIRVPNAIQAVYSSKKIEVYQGSNTVARITLLNDGRLKLENVNQLALDKTVHGTLEPEFFTKAELRDGITVQAWEKRLNNYILSTESISDSRLHLVATDITETEGYLMEDSKRMREQMKESADNNDWAHQRGNVELFIAEVSSAIERGEIVNEKKPGETYDRVKAFAAFSSEYEKRLGDIRKEEASLEKVRGDVATLSAHISTFTDATDFAERTKAEYRLETERGKVLDLEGRIAQMRSELAPIYAAKRALAMCDDSRVIRLGTENNSVQIKLNGKMLRESKERMEKRLLSIENDLKADREFLVETAASSRIALDKDWVEKTVAAFDERIDAVREAIVAVKGKTVAMEVAGPQSDDAEEGEKKTGRKSSAKTVYNETDPSVWKKLSNDERKAIIEKTAKAAITATEAIRDAEALYRRMESMSDSAKYSPKEALERGRVLFLQASEESLAKLEQCLEFEELRDYLPASKKFQSALIGAMKGLTFSNPFGARKETLETEKAALEKALNKAVAQIHETQNGIGQYTKDTLERLKDETLSEEQKDEIIRNTRSVQDFLKELYKISDTIKEMREVSYRNDVAKLLHARSEIRLKSLPSDAATVSNQVDLLQRGKTQLLPLDIIAINGIRTVVPFAKLDEATLSRAAEDMNRMRDEIEAGKARMSETIRAVESGEQTVGQAFKKDGYTIFTNTLSKGNNNIYVAKSELGFTYWVGKAKDGHPLTEKHYASAKNFSLIGGSVTEKVQIQDASGKSVEAIRWNIINRNGEEVLPYPVDRLTSDRTQIYCLAEGHPLITVENDGKYNLVDFKTRSFVLDEWQSAAPKATYDTDTKTVTVSDAQGNKLTEIDLVALSRQTQSKEKQPQVKLPKR